MARLLLSLVLSLTIAAVVCVASSVPAQEAAQACAPDIEVFCSTIPMGDGRIARCLREHQRELSPDCKRGLEIARQKVSEVHQACEDDIHVFCMGVPPGGGRTLECLKMNQARLSLQCRRAALEAR